MISCPQFHSRAIFDDSLMAIELQKTEIVFNKPLYVGMTILDISKTLIYKFHYEFMLEKFSTDQIKLLYTDTDSLLYEITCNDVYEEIIKANISKFDTSDYDLNNVYNMPLANKKIVGLMKDETKGKIITHFVGLRSKMYSFKLHVTEKEKDQEQNKLKQKQLDEITIQKTIKNIGVTKKSKGVKYDVVKNKITFDDYLHCLEENKSISETQRNILSFAHNVFSVEQTKIVLNPNDNKRHLIANSYDTLPLGHYSIME